MSPGSAELDRAIDLLVGAEDVLAALPAGSDAGAAAKALAAVDMLDQAGVPCDAAAERAFSAARGALLTAIARLLERGPLDLAALGRRHLAGALAAAA